MEPHHSESQVSSTYRAGTNERKDLRRQQLIDATIAVISRKGYTGTRLADVAAKAKVSYGVVSFYFKSKDALLLATLQSLADEYARVWREAVRQAGPSPADKLKAIVAADFAPDIANEKKIAVWYAFWAEARTRPSYRKLCAQLYNDYYWQVREFVQALIDQGGYDHLDAHSVTLALNAMVDGMWLDMQIQPREFNRDEAIRAIGLFLNQFFPREFPSEDIARIPAQRPRRLQAPLPSGGED